MAKAKGVSGTEKKTAVRRAKKASTSKIPAPAARPKASAAPKSRLRPVNKPEPKAPPVMAPVVEPAADAQSLVVASKFVSAETAARPAPRPTLPSSYGESHLLLLLRDPQTLFAAWDMAPPTVEALKTRLGRRGFAVSTLTLRLTRAGGGASVVHLAKKARSRYLKIEGGPSFVAEIGFTTPVGRFELIARSAPCFVPMGPVARQESIDAGRRAVLGYREALAAARRGGASPSPGRGSGATGSRLHPSTDGIAPAPVAMGPVAMTPRVLGGASDLYRR